MPQPVRMALLALAFLGVAGILVYLFVRAFRRSEDPARLAFHWCITLVIAGFLLFSTTRLHGSYAAVALPFACVAAAVVLTVLWGRRITEAVFRPLLSIFDGGDEEIEPRPLYSIAEAKRKQGKFHEAIFEIHGQLAKFPHDFAGQMMVAEIQAENMNDVPGAEITVQRLCQQKNHSPANLSYALSSLADWELRYAQDAEAARTALEKIVELFPDTEYSQNAQNRIAHLGTSQLLSENAERQAIKLKPGVEYVGMLKDQSHLLPKEKDFQIEAEELARHLDSYPNDTEARERLAVIYAENFQRLDLATEQIEQLINLPTESPRHIARWLNLLADLQIRCTQETRQAAETLQRIIERFPGLAFADMARQRLMTLGLELKKYEKSRVVKLGS